MRIVVTGSSGHLGEALLRVLSSHDHSVVGLDLIASPSTTEVGSITDRHLVRQCVSGADVIVHTATLHKPHLVTHSRDAFVQTNIAGTLTLLEEAVATGVRLFVFTSTTSVFGAALTPGPGRPAAWITEDVTPVPRNIYGVTKLTAEHLCEVVFKQHGLSCVILRTSRFFPEPDDDRDKRQRYDDANVKVNELLYRRADLADVVAAHVAAIEHGPSLGFGRYIISASTPFSEQDTPMLRVDPASVVKRIAPEYAEIYASRCWSMFPSIDRVYVNARARRDLRWSPKYDFAYALRCLASHEDYRSALARVIGAKGYHAQPSDDGLYPV